MQTCLDQRVIQDGVFFAARHKGEAGEIGEDSSGAVLAVEPQQGALFRELELREVAGDRREALS